MTTSNALFVKLQNRIAHFEVPAFRGAVIHSVNDAPNAYLLHNHIGDSLRNSYPLVQYKRIGGQAAIFSIGDGTKTVKRFLDSVPCSMRIGDHEEQIEIQNICEKEVSVGLSEKPERYTIKGWMPLNQNNYSTYNNTIGLSERVRLLERILKGNILSMFKGLGCYIDDVLDCTIVSISHSRVVKYKDVRRTVFDIEFTSNAEIPHLAGLGNAVSVGFGVVYRNPKQAKRNCVFLLGGHDLEMATIKELLKTNGYRFLDRNLSWENATISAYADYLPKLSGSRIVAVELRNDKETEFDIEFVDHHNERQNEKSSLEQVADIIGVKLNRWQQLVAVNDSKYIPGLESMGATAQEIADIRLADRKSQGVSPNDEILAAEDVTNPTTAGDLTIVKTRAKRFSPVVDRLWPYTQAIVYNDVALCYYGNKCQKLVEAYNKEVAEGVVYYGGGENGFLGISEKAMSPAEIQRNVEFIKSIVTK